MGQVSTEQVAIIIEETSDAIAKNKMEAQPNMNFWPLLLLAIIPVWFGWWLNNRRKK
jgi:hypothetical protein